MLVCVCEHYNVSVSMRANVASQPLLINSQQAAGRPTDATEINSTRQPQCTFTARSERPTSTNSHQTPYNSINLHGPPPSQTTSAMIPFK